MHCDPDYPFLQGRSFVFASQFAKLLPVQMGDQYISAAIDVMENENAGVPIKVSAVKAIQKSVIIYISSIHH